MRGPTTLTTAMVIVGTKMGVAGIETSLTISLMRKLLNVLALYQVKTLKADQRRSVVLTGHNHRGKRINQDIISIQILFQNKKMNSLA